MTSIKTMVLGCFLFGSTGNLNAQDGTVAAGGNASGTGGTVNYSIGVINYTTASGTGGSASLGIQQPFEIFATAIATDGGNLSAQVYPNPAADFVVLRLNNSVNQNLSYALFDMQGRIIAQQKVYTQQVIIPIAELANGAYFIKVLNNTEVKTFKIIKNQ
jgi:hypothetical protein